MLGGIRFPVAGVSLVQCTPKLIAIVSSAAILVGGGATAFAVNAQQAPNVAVPASQQGTEVLVWADGAAQRVAISEPTVAAALSAAKVLLGEHDRVSPTLGSHLTVGDSVKVSRVTVTKETKQVTLEFSKQQVEDATLEKGKTKIKTKGVAGVREDIVATITIDGVVEGTEIVSQNVVRAPVNQVTAVGTKQPTLPPTPRPPASGVPEGGQPPTPRGKIDLSLADMWDRIAKCASSSRWDLNTENGYYGGLQLSLADWRSVGGADFAAYPHQASREQQITVANRLYAKIGLRPWSCKG